MQYLSPKNDGKHYYVPIVVKNRDVLLGIISGLEYSREVMSHVLNSVGVPVEELIELNSYDADNIMSASDRFNDILPDGRAESLLTDAEKRSYLENIVKTAYDKLSCDDNSVRLDCVLKVSCTCGFGHYTWKNRQDIPTESFSCMECGNVLIDYTNHEDWEYEYCEMSDYIITKDKE